MLFTEASVSPTKVKTKSLGKKGKKKKDKHHHNEDGECTSHVHSVSFVKQERQREIV